MIKMQNDFQKVESTFITHIRIERIDLNVYLHFRNVSDADNAQCNCNWDHQTMKHVLMHYSNWLHLQLRMLQDINFSNYWIIITITKNLKQLQEWWWKRSFWSNLKWLSHSFFNMRSTQTNLIHSLIMIVLTAWSSRINSEWFSISESFAHSI